MPLRSLLITLLPFLLAGCQTLWQNPSYRYSYEGGDTVCLNLISGSDDAFSFALRQALEERGLTLVDWIEGLPAACPLVVHCYAPRDRLERRDWAAIAAELRDADGQLLLSVSAADPRGDEVLADSAVVDRAALARRLAERMFPDPVPWRR